MSAQDIQGDLRVGYAYATSTHAASCGAARTGCYIVERSTTPNGTWLKSPVLATFTPFETQAAAEAWAEARAAEWASA